MLTALGMMDGRDIVEVPLTRGLVAIIDRDDAEEVGAYKWQALVQGRHMYAKRTERYGPRSENKKRHISLHRFLMGNPEGMIVDHINGDGLDNRRSNLRVCSHAENLRNRVGPPIHNTSGYIGVSLIKESGRFHAYIRDSERERIHLGNFACPIEAAIARDVAAIELHGEFASLNFPHLAEVLQ